MNAVRETMSIWNTINLKTCWNFIDLRSFDMDSRLFYFPSQFDGFFFFFTRAFQRKRPSWNSGSISIFRSVVNRSQVLITWDHFLKELRHQALLSNQAFWWFVNNSTLTSPDWLKCDWRGTGKETFLLLAQEKTNGKLSINPMFL